LPTLGRPTMTREGSFCDMFSGVETLARAEIVCRFEGDEVTSSKMGGAPPPGCFHVRM
jgi:hypothetical protein